MTQNQAELSNKIDMKFKFESVQFLFVILKSNWGSAIAGKNAENVLIGRVSGGELQPIIVRFGCISRPHACLLRSSYCSVIAILLTENDFINTYSVIGVDGETLWTFLVFVTVFGDLFSFELVFLLALLRLLTTSC